VGIQAPHRIRQSFIAYALGVAQIVSANALVRRYRHLKQPRS